MVADAGQQQVYEGVKVLRAGSLTDSAEAFMGQPTWRVKTLKWTMSEQVLTGGERTEHKKTIQAASH